MTFCLESLYALDFQLIAIPLMMRFKPQFKNIPMGDTVT